MTTTTLGKRPVRRCLYTGNLRCVSTNGAPDARNTFYVAIKSKDYLINGLLIHNRAEHEEVASLRVCLLVFFVYQRDATRIDARKRTQTQQQRTRRRRRRKRNAKTQAER